MKISNRVTNRKSNGAFWGVNEAQVLKKSKTGRSREGKKDVLLKLNKLWFMISVMRKAKMELQNLSIKMDFAV